MTFLELVQKVVLKAGIAESGPATVVNQFGDYLRAITFVQTAHAEIQNMYFDWDFLWRTDSLPTQANLATYAGPSDLGIWDVDRIFLNGNKLNIVDWKDYRPENLDPAMPYEGVIQPNGQLRLIPTPDSAYTVTFDYFRRPLVLVSNSDTPLIPSQFHDVIVGRAMMTAGNYESGMDIKTEGAELYQQFLQQLKDHQLSLRQQRQGRMGGTHIQVEVE
jgi:hypothetical protein